MVLMYFDKCTCTNKRKNGWDKRRICNLLEKNTNQIAKSDIKIILGDINARVNKEIIYIKSPKVMKVYITNPTTVE